MNDRHRRQAAAYKDARAMQVGAKKGKKGKKAKGKTGPADAKRSKSEKSMVSTFVHDLSSVAADDGSTACCLPLDLPPPTTSFFVANGAAVHRGLAMRGESVLYETMIGAVSCGVLVVAVALLITRRLGMLDTGPEYSPKVLMGEPAERIHQRMLGEDPAQEYALPNFKSVLNFT